MKLTRLMSWGMLLVFLAAAVFPVSVQAEGETPEYATIYDTSIIFLPITMKPGTSNPPLPTPQLTNIIDHTTLPLYDQIPDQYLRGAEAIRFMFLDRSVGSNINDGVTCLAASSWAASPANCRNYYSDLVNLTNNRTYTVNDTFIPEPIRFPGGNNRANISFDFSGGAYWYEDVQYFVNNYPNLIANRDIVSWMPNYLQVGSDSTIAAQFFNMSYSGPGYNVRHMLDLEAQYPNKTFVYYTSSLARIVGTSQATSFNSQMRTWARDNNKILIDVAAIISHTPAGVPCVNAQGYPIICREYTTESEGGHLGAVSAGKLRVAKAIWILLAQLAGWDGTPR